MTVSKSKLWGAVGRACPDLQIFVRSSAGTRFLSVTTKQQAALLAFGFLFVVWSLVATGAVVISALWSDSSTRQVNVLSAAYQERLASLSGERDAAREDARAFRQRFAAALERIDRQQKELIEGIRVRQELDTSLDVTRNKLADAVIALQTARSEATELAQRLDAVVAGLDAREGSRRDLRETIETVSLALSDAARNRDAAYREVSRLESTLAQLEIRMKVNAERRDLMFTRLEEAVSTSFEPLNKMFENSGIDLDGLMSQVRRDYSGTGGPLLPVATSSKSMPSGKTIAEQDSSLRFKTLMHDLDNLNLIRIAAAQVPLAKPVRARYRHTSGYGMRHDPKTGAMRMHKGMDFAAPRGTPILATADGTVIFAGVQRGYGKFIRIRHSFGFVTAYAH
ncbi:MAG: DUF5930 domain-containing protein, partial [Paracoccaceae bacterium]